MDNGLSIDCSKLLQEILVGSAFAQVKRSLLSDAVSLARYLPITMSKNNIPLEVKVTVARCLTIKSLATVFIALVQLRKAQITMHLHRTYHLYNIYLPQVRKSLEYVKPFLKKKLVHTIFALID